MEIPVSELDPAVLEEYAAHLERKAGAVVARWTAAASLVGAGLGAVALTSWASWPVPHREAYGLVLLGAVAGAVLGRSLGGKRSRSLALQAQLARHQLHFERFFLGATRPRAAAAEPSPVPQPEPPVVPVAPPSVPAGAPPVSAAMPLPGPDAF